MTEAINLCASVKNKRGFLAALGPQVECAGDESSCCIVSPHLKITMEIDARDGSLDADILFLDLPDELRESHPAHVVARFFSDLTLNNVKAAKEFREKLDLQLSNLVEIVTRANSLTPAQVRDISYFAQGYAAGYTDRYR